jgi:hypothetical protein
VHSIIAVPRAQVPWAKRASIKLIDRLLSAAGLAGPLDQQLPDVARSKLAASRHC